MSTTIVGKMFAKLFVLIVFAVSVNSANQTFNKKILCYHDYWSIYRAEGARFGVKSINSSLCTHVVYASAGIGEDNKIQILDPYLQLESHDLTNFTRHNKNKTKSLIAIGGAGVRTDNFTRMAANDATRTTFVESVISFLREYGFDGLMLDWEFPDKEDYQNYAKLLDKFDELLAHTTFTFGITVSPLKYIIDSGYDMQHIIHLVDFVNVLTYDYHGPWENKTDHSSPLYQPNTSPSIPMSQSASLQYWHEKGVPKEKLLMSIPLFGRSWKLYNPQNPGRGAFADGPGTAGPLTRQAGILAYHESCSMSNADPQLWSTKVDTSAIAVYSVHNNLWVSHESANTVTTKAKFVDSEGYGGISVYSLSYDDFSGVCGEKFALLLAVNNGLNRQIPVDKKEDPEEPERPVNFKCVRNGYFRDYNDCRKWYVCATNSLGVFEQSINFCEKGYAFDEITAQCQLKQNVVGCENDLFAR